MRLQDKSSQKVAELKKVGTVDNLADALTKGVDAKSIQYHMEGMSIDRRDDSRRLAPVLEGADGAEMKFKDEV